MKLVVTHLKYNQIFLMPIYNLKNLLSVHKSPEGFFNFIFYFFINLFIYLFLAVLGLRYCMRAFSSCSKRGLSFVAVCGFLTAVSPLVAEHGL